MEYLGAGEECWKELVNNSRLERIPEVSGKLVVYCNAEPGDKKRQNWFKK